MQLPYDKHNPLSIEEYSKQLEEKSFRELLPQEVKSNLKKKGELGTLLEEYYFKYKPNSEAGPDFAEAGVELKVTPFKKNKNKTLSAKERLVLNIINFMNITEETFETSSFWRKNKLILLVYYLYEKDQDRLDYLIKHVRLFEFPEKDMKIIKDDWEKIKQKVMDGRAHEISESDTNYLSACTKGANSSSVREQPNSYLPAKQRAYSLKSSYMTYILREYILKGFSTYKNKKPTPQSITENLGDLTLEDYIINQFNPYIGNSLGELIELLELNDKRNSKSITHIVASKIVNREIKDLRKTEEFQKANIQVKAIRISLNGKIKESMSFPSFKYTEIVKENWEDSELRLMFLEKRYLFIVFQEMNDKGLVLQRVLFWNIPSNDLETHIKGAWEETVKRILGGKADQLPQKKENPVCHVRPHAQNKNDTYPTPYGTNEVKKSFWLNNDYILEQITKYK
jgi:DNA mismatch repair protein MutH